MYSENKFKLDIKSLGIRILITVLVSVY